MIKIFAKGISVLFQPLFLATYLFGIVFSFHPLVFSPLSWEIGRWFIILILITTCIIPLLSLILMRFLSNLSSLSMYERKERIIPFFFIALFYGITTWLVYERLSLHGLIVHILITITILILSIAVITLYYKISVHSAGMGGLFGFFWAFALVFREESFALSLAIVSLLCGLVISARLYLNAHHFGEVVLGGILGFVICFGSIFLFA